MKRSSFSVLFFVKKSRASRKTGLAPITVRITVNGVRAEFQTKRSVDPQRWNQHKEKATGKDALSIEVNKYLDNLRAELYELLLRKISSLKESKQVLEEEPGEKP